MMNSIRHATLLILVVTLLMAPMGVSAIEMHAMDEVNVWSVVGDVLVCRPLGIAATVIGSAVFIVSLPFSALGHNVDETASILVKEPFRFTFQRPVGKF